MQNGLWSLKSHQLPVATEILVLILAPLCISYMSLIKVQNTNRAGSLMYQIQQYVLASEY